MQYLSRLFLLGGEDAERVDVTGDEPANFYNADEARLRLRPAATFSLNREASGKREPTPATLKTALSDGGGSTLPVESWVAP